MSLNELALDTLPSALPTSITDLIEEADATIFEFQETMGEQACPLFEPAEYNEVAEALRWIQHSLQPGLKFCEWGCGFGVVAGIAGLCGFDATGIENDALLLDQAHVLQSSFQLSSHLVHADLFNLSDEEGRIIGPARFDLIYAYPWPKEIDRWTSHFEHTARSGALFLTFHEFGELRLLQKS